MALLTRLSADDAREILASFDLVLESLEPLPAQGTVNSNFRVAASGRGWFLRVNEGKGEADVRAEAALIGRLAARGVPTVEPLGVRPFGAKWVTLFPWVAGREARALDDAPLVGEALGRIHAVALDGELPRNHYSLDELERRLGGFGSDARFVEVAPALSRELESARRRDRGPEGLIHQDLFPDNLLVDDAGAIATVLDFEQATRGPLVYDLAVALNAWCWDGAAIVREAAERVVAAYQILAGPVAAPSLLVDECRLAAARFTITRITDVFLPDGVDEELRRKKDWRDYARRLQWWAAQ